MQVPNLYHWSPSERRGTIRRDGLRPYSRCTVSCGYHGESPVTYGYVCLSPDPTTAWELSGDLHWVTEYEEWDLWQARLVDGDEIHFGANFEPFLREVRVCTPIPADRVWYVGTRSQHPYAEPVAG